VVDLDQLQGRNSFFVRLEQGGHRNCGCPLPGGVQGQAGWGFEQPDLAEGVPAHGKGLN